MAKFQRVESLLFPCPKCKHNNRPATNKFDAVKLFLTDKLPRCRKCGYELRKRHFDLTKIPERLMVRARSELGLAQETQTPPTNPAKRRRFIVDADGRARTETS
jgi:hypothetical protein